MEAMRFAIECVDRIGVAQDVLNLVAQEQFNLQGIELKKLDERGIIYLNLEDIATFQVDTLFAKLKKITGVEAISVIDSLPSERRAIALNSLLESLPNPVLSLDLSGRIEFANQQARKLLIPYLATKQAQKTPHLVNLQGILLTECLPQLKQEKWYSLFLSHSKNHTATKQEAISQHIHIDNKTWRIDLLPIYLSESTQPQLVGSVVVLQSHENLRIDLHHFNAYQQQSFQQIVTHSRKMAELVEQAKKFALLDAPLLIQGETGVGKELLAKACHQFSQRKEKRFIAVNCAGLPAEDAESEMFGYHSVEKKSIGFFEYADGGTVLLDHIAELSLPMQAKLLRFLNDGTFRRVGEEQEHSVNVRVICTSQIPLATYVEQGMVREDLFHRLNVLSLTIPPLRERREDIPELVTQFVTQISQQLGIATPLYGQDFLDYLMTYHWSGNVRELYNSLYRACSLSDDGELAQANLNLAHNIHTAFNLEQVNEGSLDEIMGHFEEAVLRKFYVEYPSTRKLAQRLGISHTAIANKLRQYGIVK